MFGRKLNTEEQKIWITSDLHFDHGNIMKFCPETRKFSTLQEMNEALIAEWNTKVGEDDYIIHLGDFCFKGKEVTESFLRRLNGKKTMILGNHDKALRNSISTGSHNITWKGDYLELTINKQKICLSHYPMTTWNQAGRGSLQLYGHCHGSLPQPKGRQMDVGYDAVGEILNIEQVISKLNKKEIYVPDHH